jgi:MarR family transcriptional regulator, temperature-dependent positive regulator of motility
MSAQRSTTDSHRRSQTRSATPKSAVLLMYRRLPGHLARRLQQVSLGIISESLADEGLTQLQWATLVVVADTPNIDQRRLAEALGIAPVNAGQIARELETMGLVRRRTNGADRRARELRITEPGVKLTKRVRPSNYAAQDRILAPLAPKEREVLMDLLVRVIEGNEAYARPGNGRRKCT